jgi:transposase
MVHVGIDLHHTSSYVRAIAADGTMHSGVRVHHGDLGKLWQYLGQFGNEPKRVVFEAVSNSRWLQRLLSQDESIEAVAVTPHKIRIIAETVAKTDKIDAGVLANLSRMDALPKAWLPDKDVEHLRELVRYRSNIVYLRTRGKNRVNSVLVRLGIVRPYADIFGTLGRRWLNEIEMPDVMRFQIDSWLEMIDAYNKKINAVEKQINKLFKSPRWHQDASILETMPGWGNITVMTVLAELGDYRRFKNRASVSCFAGLVPVSKRSDKSCRYGHLSNHGSKQLRSILVEVAINAVRKVPRYSQLYLRLQRERGGSVAKAAIARQMLEDGWTMLIKREPFRYVEQVVTVMRAG